MLPHKRPFLGKSILKKNRRQDAEPSEEEKVSNENEADENAIVINSATKRSSKTLQPPAPLKTVTPTKQIDTINDI